MAPASDLDLSAPDRLTRPARPKRTIPERRRVLAVAFTVGCLLIAFGTTVPYLVTSMAQLAESNAGLASHYVDQPLAIQNTLKVHAGTGGLALALTPLLVSSRLRRRYPRLHRVSGRVSVAAIGVSAASGLVVAQVSYAGWSGRIGFSMLSVIWAWSAVKTVTAARAGRMAEHRRWAIRTAALTAAAVTLRLVLVVLIAAQAPGAVTDPQVAFDRAYVLTPFLSWIPNLALAEWLLRRRPQLVR